MNLLQLKRKAATQGLKLQPQEGTTGFEIFPAELKGDTKIAETKFFDNLTAVERYLNG